MTFVIIYNNLLIRLLFFNRSLTCTIIPILINLIVAVYIIYQENSNNSKFQDYFANNTTIVSICSVLAGADIKILQILSSKIAGLDIFSAKFSDFID